MKSKQDEVIEVKRWLWFFGIAGLVVHGLLAEIYIAALKRVMHMQASLLNDEM